MSNSTAHDESASQSPQQSARGGFSIPSSSHSVWTGSTPSLLLAHLGHARYKMLVLRQDDDEAESDIQGNDQELPMIMGPMTDFLKTSFRKSSPVSSSTGMPSTPRTGKPPISKDFDYYIFKRIIKARLLPLAARPEDSEINVPTNPPVWAVFGPGMAAREIHGQEQFAECLKQFWRHVRHEKNRDEEKAGELGMLYFLVGVV